MLGSRVFARVARRVWTIILERNLDRNPKEQVMQSVHRASLLGLGCHTDICPLAICQLVCQHMPPPDWLESALIRDGKLKEEDKVSCLSLVGSGKLFERTVYLQSCTSHSRFLLAISNIGSRKDTYSTYPDRRFLVGLIERWSYGSY